MSDLPRPLDMDDLETQGSEFSWGPGITPPGLENASPREGGRYHGHTPPGENRIGVSR